MNGTRYNACRTVFFVSCIAVASNAAAAEPPLPPGLDEPARGESSEPVLPPGLGGGGDEPDLPFGLPESSAPALRAGLGAADEEHVVAGEESLSPLDIDSEFSLEFGGFVEGRLGVRTQRDPHEKAVSIGETRLQLETDVLAENWSARFVTDLLYDPVVDRHRPDLETGDGLLDLREAWLSFSLFENTDVKVGRQIMTWGTGDLLFINDLFPKGWDSFFIGRDEEYLKAPSDALRVNVYTDLVNVDIAYVPNFDSDRFIDGSRISFFNSGLLRRSGRDAVVRTDRPNRWFRDDELHYRLHRRFDAYEVAVYGYHGFWKSPAGQTPAGLAAFPALNVYGASVRGPVAGGIGNAEVGFYDSEQDRGGDDGFVDNSMVKFLAGFEREVVTDVTLGVQYYVEHMLRHDGYRASLPPGVDARDEFRHLLTARLTWQLMNQNLILSMFAYLSPSDRDAYLRPSVKYKIDDHWTAQVGGNIFLGAEQHTFFAQFERNTNVYASLRYGF